MAPPIWSGLNPLRAMSTPIMQSALDTSIDAPKRAFHLDQAGHSDGLADAAQARQLSASERPGRGAARAGPYRAHAVHPGLAAKRRVAPPGACRAEQGGSAQRA